jgi:hypothetical protein
VAGMRACPRGICRSDPLREYSRKHTLNVTDLQFVCHWIVTLGIIRSVQKFSSFHSMSVKKGRTAMQYARSPAKEHKDQFSLI